MERLKRNHSDILFFSSSNKPNVQPAMNWFATDLAERDWKVCWWGPNEWDRKASKLSKSLTRLLSILSQIKGIGWIPKNIAFLLHFLVAYTLDNLAGPAIVATSKDFEK